MSVQPINITSPVGRIVAGSLYKANTTNFEGQPMKVMTGPNAGQARSEFFFAIAVPKNPGETHWSATPWGKLIWELGHAAFPQGAQRPDFAWKIEDGDSIVPNKRNKRPVDIEGYAGNWVLKFKSGFAPKIYRMEGTQYVQEMTADFVKPGHYIQVAFVAAGNENQNNPGVYLNHSMVMFRAYGPEITFGPNVEDAGFGQAPLPPGASAVPLAASAPLPASPVTPPAAPVPQPTVTGVAPASVSPSSPIPVVPNPGFLQMPPPPPAAPAGPTMTPLAKGITYQAYKAANWSDEQLVAAGLMTL